MWAELAPLLRLAPRHNPGGGSPGALLASAASTASGTRVTAPCPPVGRRCTATLVLLPWLWGALPDNTMPPQHCNGLAPACAVALLMPFVASRRQCCWAVWARAGRPGSLQRGPGQTLALTTDGWDRHRPACAVAGCLGWRRPTASARSWAVDNVLGTALCGLCRLLEAGSAGRWGRACPPAWSSGPTVAGWAHAAHEPWGRCHRHGHAGALSVLWPSKPLRWLGHLVLTTCI